MGHAVRPVRRTVDTRGRLARPAQAYLVAQLLPDGSVGGVLVSSERQPEPLRGGQSVVVAEARGATFADAHDRLVAAVTRPAPQSPYPLPPGQGPLPIPRTPSTDLPATLPPGTTPEEARWKDRAAWTGIAVLGGAAGWLIWRSLAAATVAGAAVVGGGMLVRDWNRARLLDGRRGA